MSSLITSTSNFMSVEGFWCDVKESTNQAVSATETTQHSMHVNASNVQSPFSQTPNSFQFDKLHSKPLEIPDIFFSKYAPAVGSQHQLLQPFPRAAHSSLLDYTEYKRSSFRGPSLDQHQHSNSQSVILQTRNKRGATPALSIQIPREKTVPSSMSPLSPHSAALYPSPHSPMLYHHQLQHHNHYEVTPPDSPSLQADFSMYAGSASVNSADEQTYQLPHPSGGSKGFMGIQEYSHQQYYRPNFSMDGSAASSSYAMGIDSTPPAFPQEQQSQNQLQHLTALEFPNPSNAPSIPKFKCPCGRMFLKLCGLKSHTKVHENNGASLLRNPEPPHEMQWISRDGQIITSSPLPENEGSGGAAGSPLNYFSCVECGKAFLRRQDLRRHRVLHSLGYKRFRCDDCKTTFSRSDALFRHIKSKRCHRDGIELRVAVCGSTVQGEGAVIEL